MQQSIEKRLQSISSNYWRAKPMKNSTGCWHGNMSSSFRTQYRSFLYSAVTPLLWHSEERTGNKLQTSNKTYFPQTEVSSICEWRAGHFEMEVAITITNRPHPHWTWSCLITSFWRTGATQYMELTANYPLTNCELSGALVIFGLIFQSAIELVSKRPPANTYFTYLQ